MTIGGPGRDFSRDAKKDGDPMSEESAIYRVGVARTDITPPVGARLGGYGARQGVSDSVAGQLSCTAVVFDDGVTRVCLASCDLLYVTSDVLDAVRRRVTERTGIGSDAIMMVATHTHSGPADLTAEADPEYFRLLVDRIAEAVETAARSTEPATVRSSEASLSGISLNRRDPAGPIERRIRTLVAESVTGQRTIAVLMNYACHATVLEADSLAISPDFPGAAVTFVESETGATAAYLQGCAGAINPVWIDHTVDEVRRIGSLLGSVVLQQVLDGQGVARARRSVNLSMITDVEAERGPLAGKRLTGPLWHHTAIVRLHPRPTRSTAAIDQEIADLTDHEKASQGAASTAELASLQAERYLSKGGFRYWSGTRRNDESGSSVEEIEIPAIGFGGSLALLGIPGEPFLEIGESIRRLSGFDDVVVCGYSNGTVGYLPTREAFADHGYEVGMARYTPDAADRIVEAGAALLREHAR